LTNKGTRDQLISEKVLRSVEFKVTNNTKFITNFVIIEINGILYLIKMEDSHANKRTL
jgi:hypothetical protein